MPSYFHENWLALVLIAAGVFLLAWNHRRWLVPGVALMLLGVGGHLPLLVQQTRWHMVPLLLVYPVLAGLFMQFLVLVVTGRWSAPIAWGLAAMLCLGVGASAFAPVAFALEEAWTFLLSLEFARPAWLVLLILVPILIYLSWRRLAGLGPVRRFVALGLRCAVVILLALALAETHARQPDRDVTVLFLWDRSLSMPAEYVGTQNIRQKRVLDFINDAVAKRGAVHQNDRAGVIVFARRPRLELPPASVPKLNFKSVQSTLDDTHTDIAAAIKLALASFPEGTAKRIVLISDGNENLGHAQEQARLAKQNGVQIDVVPVAAGQQRTDEVLVERIEAPAVLERESRVPLRVVLRSFHPQVVVGDLQIIRVSLELRKAQGEKQELPVFEAEPVVQSKVKLRQGLNVFFFQQPGVPGEESFTYEARFVPTHVETPEGKKVQDRLVGDHVQNNRASTSVLARGQRAVLLIEPNSGPPHKLLLERLQQGSSLKVVSIQPQNLPADPAQFALVLSKFDSVILANVPAEELSEAQQSVLRSNTHDQGAGLVMIGGPNGFGAGGWQNTEVEKALPVLSDLKSSKVDVKGGLVLMMHASEMAEGNAWQKKIAKLAIDKLSPADMVGVIYYAWDGKGHTWHIPFQSVGNKRGTLLRLVDSMDPGDMPDVDPQLNMAYSELANVRHQLGTKHIIFISDGDHWDATPALLKKVGAAGITCTTVCITTHGQAEIAKMKRMSQMVMTPGKKTGNSYHITDPSTLPAIYIKETRIVSKSFVDEKEFPPVLALKHGPTEGIDKLAPLHGFVRTTKRPSPLVEINIETPKINNEVHPILASWTYGLGKGVAFTSDARTNPGGDAYWDRDWANSAIYAPIWKQTIEWSLRPVETGKHLFLTTEQKDGKVRVIIDAQDADKKPLTTVQFKAGITSPAAKNGVQKLDLKFEQKSSGIYEAEFPADEIGAYFINVQGKWTKDGKEIVDSVRAGVSIPYSPEFAEMESNTAMLDRLAQETGGVRYEDNAEVLEQVAASGELFRPVPGTLRSLQALWYFLVVLAGFGLFLDVATRRISLEPGQVWAKAAAWWLYLRGRPAVAESGQFLERLKSRKAQADESIDKGKSTRRFDGPEQAPPPPPEGAPAPPKGPPPRPVTPPPVKPAKKDDDFAARLMRAKKRALEDRDKG